MKTIDRFFLFLEWKEVSYNYVEKLLDVSNGYLGKMRIRHASVGSDIIEKIVAKFPELNPVWLVSGEGEMLRTQNHTKERLYHFKNDSTFNNIISFQNTNKRRDKRRQSIRANHFPIIQCSVCLEKDKRINDLQEQINRLESIIKEFILNFHRKNNI